jgi:hypothetical protein
MRVIGHISNEVANVNKIGIIQNENKSEYMIVTEFSLLPVESFSNITAAIDFCRGYLGLSVKIPSKAYHDGQFLRMCIESDIEVGYLPRKLNDISNALLFERV